MHIVNKKFTFESSLHEYLQANKDWITKDEVPLMTALHETAAVLDRRITAGLLTQYRMLMEDLHKRKPAPKAVKKEELDEFDKMISEFQMND